MKILALDTSTDACSVALYVAGEVREYFEVVPRAHTQLLMSMIERQLAEAGVTTPRNLDGIAFGRGPGSFTGLRIAAGVAQGIAFAAQLPVSPISTLAALAENHFATHDSEWVLAALDARMDEVYWGLYRRDAGRTLCLYGEEQVARVGEMSLPDLPVCSLYGVGSGWRVHGEALRHITASALSGYDGMAWPRAASIARLAAGVLSRGEGVVPGEALPVYLRDKVAKTLAERGVG